MSANLPLTILVFSVALVLTVWALVYLSRGPLLRLSIRLPVIYKERRCN
jgi:hypothetical protein